MEREECAIVQKSPIVKLYESWVCIKIEKKLANA